MYLYPIISNDLLLPNIMQNDRYLHYTIIIRAWSIIYSVTQA